jgi:hypothetical protein
MHSWQSHLAWHILLFVIDLSERCQLVVGDIDDAVSMAAKFPVSLRSF